MSYASRDDSDVLQADRAAELGYRVSGINEIQRREWYSVTEYNDPADAWLSEHDPEAPAPKAPKLSRPFAIAEAPSTDTATCVGCGVHFLSRGPTGQAKKWCSDRCGRSARSKAFFQRGDTARRDKYRRYKTSYMRHWRATNPERFRQNQRNYQRRKTERLHGAPPAPPPCVDCGVEFSTGERVIVPRPQRCGRCRRERKNALARATQARARQRLRKLLQAEAAARRAFSVGDFATWRSQTGMQTEKRGEVVAVVPAGSTSDAVVAGLAFTFSPDKRKKSGGKTRDHESYLVLVGRALYWPPVEWLTVDPAGAPVPRTLLPPPTEPVVYVPKPQRRDEIGPVVRRRARGVA